MEKDTYEFEKSTCRLEYIEWDDIWRENAPEEKARRILLIGDSITRSYRDLVNKRLSGKAYADQLATSKAIDSDGYIALINYMCSQCNSYDIVQFNNGLHGFHLDNESYQKNYIKIIKCLVSLYPNAKIIVATTTPVRVRGNLAEVDERNNIVIERNNIACEIANSFNLEVVDLYEVIDNKQELYINDGVHLSVEGCDMIAEKCVKTYHL